MQEKIDEYIKNFPLIEVLSVRDESSRQNAMNSSEISKTLDNIEPLEMLEILFNQKDIPENQRKIFIPMYKEILQKTGAEI